MSLSKIGYKILLAIPVLLIATPAFAFTYTRTPSNTGEVSLPLSITVNLTNADITAACPIPPTGVRLLFNNNSYTAIQPIIVGNNVFNFTSINRNGLEPYNVNFPINNPRSVNIQPINSNLSCDYIPNPTGQDLNVPWYPAAPVIINNAFLTPASTSAAILSNISGQFADPGTLAFMVLASGIIVGFWVLRKFLKVMPK